MKTSYFLFSVAMLFGIAVSSHAETVSLPASASPAGHRNIQESLKTAVLSVFPKLGDLEPWQRKIFDEEVVPQYLRFVKDYRPSTGGLSVEVDVDSIKKYLVFYGPKALRQAKPSLVILANAEPTCAKCVTATENITKILKNRAERRGMVPVFMTPEQLKDPSRSGEALDEDMRSWARKKKIAGVMITECKETGDDPDHPDEKRFSVRLSLAFPQNPTDKNSAVAKSEFSHASKLDVLENDSIELAIAKLSNEAWTAAASQGETIVQNQSGESQRVEVLVEVAGITDFKHFTRVKERIQTALGEAAPIMERKITRGMVTFAVQTAKTPEDIKKQLIGVSFEPGTLFLNDVSENLLRTEIR